MKTKSPSIIFFFCGAVLFANTANAQNNFEDRARVTSVREQIEKFNQPRQECRTEYIRESGWILTPSAPLHKK